MSKKDKLIQNIKNNPKNVDFKTIKNLLENFGYKAFNTGGSHFVFRQKDKEPITIPHKKPVKTIYIKQILKILGV